jgi:hypothetical protein
VLAEMPKLFRASELAPIPDSSQEGQR